MRLRMYASVGLALLLASVWLCSPPPSTVSAQAAERLTSLSIDVWPEYDDPRVLVQVEGELAVKTGLPRTVFLYLPAGASIHASAYANDKGDYLNTDPPILEPADEGWFRASFNLPAPRFHFEYYYDPLRGGPDKLMDLAFRLAQPADRVRLEIQVPLKAENFATEPPAAQIRSTEQHNFKYHVFDYTAVAADQILKVRVSYRKTDPNPSLANVTVPTGSGPASSNPAPASASSASNSNSWIPVVLVAAGLAMGGLAGFAWYTQRQQAAAAAPSTRRPRKHKRSGAGGFVPSPAAIESVFCTQCGRGLAADENFCPRCGAPRRR